jgi:hypothetical protein
MFVMDMHFAENEDHLGCFGRDFIK